VVVNTGDDFELLGLAICPDLDTVTYTLAGFANPVTGWGRVEETWQALETIGALGGPTWFRLGDRDLGLHLERTRRRRLGQPLSQITAHICQVFGILVKVLPMTDDSTPTWVYTIEGEMPFQEYFVRRQCQPQVTGFRFAGIEQAVPAPGVLDALQAADLVVICPSNPWVSIDPILAVPGVCPALSAKPVVAVSPIIGGRTVKGPAAKMFGELGIQPSALAVAEHYGGANIGGAKTGGLLSGFILDQADIDQDLAIQQLGVTTLVTDTLMKTAQDRARLAKEVIDFASHHLQDI